MLYDIDVLNKYKTTTKIGKNQSVYNIVDKL